MAEMRNEVKQKISKYIASVVSDKTPDSINQHTESRYVDTAPPFYRSGIVLP